MRDLASLVSLPLPPSTLNSNKIRSWTLGPDWPNNGEVDIIEGVHQQAADSMALHTSSGCTISNAGFTGTLHTSNCYVHAAGQPANSGCGIGSNNDQSYGNGFNAVGGGVYAMEWTSDAINIWFFARNAIPGDIPAGTPNPAGWGTPMGKFAGGCDIDSHFADHKIVSLSPHPPTTNKSQRSMLTGVGLRYNLLRRLGRQRLGHVQLRLQGIHMHRLRR